MWSRNGWLTASLIGCCLVATASAQQGVDWNAGGLESAKTAASRSNRLVLIHFYADWCQPCKTMDRDVFSRADVATAVQNDFVPVKINADHRPQTAKQYGVTALPTDVIITPDGQVVNRFSGRSDASQYVGKLTAIAANYRQQSPAMYAQGSAPSGPFAAPAGAPVAAAAYPAFQPQPVEPRYSNQAMPGQTASTAIPPVDRSAGMPPGYGVAGQWQPPAAPPGFAYGAPTANPAMPQMPMADAGPVPNPSAPAFGPLPNAAPTAPAMQAAPADVAQGFQPPAPSNAPAPPANPPLGLDGYCAVQLSENERWVPGNPQWGVIHRGKTYLFSGPEEQKRFYDNPDRYAPVLDGCDIVTVVERGQGIDGRREHGAWFQDRVYLFASEQALERFSAEPQRYLTACRQLGLDVPDVPVDTATGLSRRPTQQNSQRY